MHRAVLLGIALWLAGCAGGDDGAIRILDFRPGGLGGAELLTRVRLSEAAREGLDRGVALGFRLDVEDASGRRVLQRELRYLPLTRQYQVRGPAPGYSRGYDSRAAALAALERWPLPDDLDRPRRLRLRLDGTRLPAPLVLPALFVEAWRLDTGRVPWPDAPR